MSLHDDMLIGVIDRCDTDRRSVVVVQVAINTISDFTEWLVSGSSCMCVWVGEVWTIRDVKESLWNALRCQWCSEAKFVQYWNWYEPLQHLIGWTSRCWRWTMWNLALANSLHTESLPLMRDPWLTTGHFLTFLRIYVTPNVPFDFMLRPMSLSTSLPRQSIGHELPFSHCHSSHYAYTRRFLPLVAPVEKATSLGSNASFASRSSE